jgi:hypothetical protein
MNQSAFRRVKRSARPALEGLEGKALLSSLGSPVGPMEVQSQVVQISAGRVVLDGTIRGTVRRYHGATIGAEPAFVLSGVGQHATIGRARVDGFIMPAPVETTPHGTLTVKTPRGNLVLALDAMPQTSGGPALIYRYTIQKGTGAYVGATGSGTAHLSLPKGLPVGSGATPYTITLQSDRTLG